MGSRVVIVPGPGIGHLNGCLLLCKALLSTPSFSTITIVCFARSYGEHISSGRVSIPSHPSIQVQVLEDGKPADHTSNVQLFAITPTMHDNLAGLLRRLHNEARPAAVCLITDMIMAWTQLAADAVGIPRVELWTASATSYLCLIAIPQLASAGFACCHKGEKPAVGWKTEEKMELDCIPGMPGFALEDVPRELRFAHSCDQPLVENFVIAAHNAQKAACVLLHSFFDLEPEAFEALRQHMGVTPYSIGSLLQHEEKQAIDSSTGEWLDRQVPASIMYVSFGSAAKLCEAELLQLALGLQASGHPFLLVVRKDGIMDGARPLQEILPPDFFAHAAAHGLILPWAPQRALLAHPAVGGFLSHCGWNSTMESLWCGVPILACPRAAEQPINLRLIVHRWGVGVELPTALDGSFSKEDVSTGVKSILAGDIGRHARSNAQTLSKKVREAAVEGGHSYASLLAFGSATTSG